MPDPTPLVNAPDPAAAVRQTDKPEVVVAALAELQSSDTTTLLDQLTTAIDEERFEDAGTLLEQLQQQYENQRTTEATTIARVQAIRSAPDTDLADIKQATQYLRSATATQLTRAELLSRVAAFVETAGEAIDRSTASTLTTTARQQEDQFEQTTQTIESELKEQTAPPSVAVPTVMASSQTIGKNEQATVTATIMNAGRELAEEVTVTASTTAPVSLNRTSISIGRLDADSTTEQTFTITGTESGTGTVTITVESANAGRATGMATITVHTSHDKRTAAYYANDQTGVVDTDGLFAAIDDWQDGEIEQKTLSKVIDSWKGGDPIA